MSALHERELGRYELLIELGRGGMAELFLGRLRGAGGFAKLVAIKRILPHLAQDRHFTEMFLEEGRIASRLSHPNVCQVFELGEVGGTLFLAMEYLDGVSWDHLAAIAPAGSTRLVAGVLGQAADGLHYAHTLRDVDGRATPVIHRDVSPQNLFVTIDGVCKVLDFGVSKMMTDGPRTRSGVIKGKLPYMAPEQIRGEPVDARADVFSLGVCAWEAFARTRLYDRESDFQIWKAITEEDAPPLAAPPAIAAVVKRALERDPNRRHPSAQAFAAELRAAAGFAAPAEIAELVRTLCGARIAERARRVAQSDTTTAPAPGTAVHTDAGETLDLKAQGSAMQLRSEAIAVKRPPPPKSHVKTAVIAASLAAAISAALVLVVMMLRTPATTPAPDAAPPVDRLPASDARPRDPYGVGRLYDLKRNLEQLRDDLQPAIPKGRYVVDSTPKVTIFANGSELGTTPLDVELAAGTYEIRAVLDDDHEKTFSVEIEAGKPTASPRLTW